MKLMIASDIHGSAYYCKKLLEAFDREHAGRLLLLGDILYHGPRNDLPREYAPKEVIELLNARKNSIFCVRGNCDTQVDQMVLQFPILADYCILPVGKHLIYATHGHEYNEAALPPLCPGDLLLNGHTHVPKCTEHEQTAAKPSYVYLNPGSVSIPKEDSWHGYLCLEELDLIWKDLEGNIRLHYRIDG